MTLKDYGPALRAFLLDDSAISDLVDARIWPQPYPQGRPAPAITYVVAGGAPVPVHSEGMAGHRGPRIQIDCWGNTRDEAAALDLAVLARLGAYRGEMGSAEHAISVQGVFPEDGRTGFEEDLPLHRVIRDYQFWFEG